MLLLMAAILFLGACTIILFFARHGHRFSRQVAATKEFAVAEARATTDAAADLDNKLVEWLLEGSDTRSAIDRWQQQRSALLPGADWYWTADVLNRRRAERLNKEFQSLKQRALYGAIVGTVVILVVFGGTTLGVYAYYSTFRHDPSSSGQPYRSGLPLSIPDEVDIQDGQGRPESAAPSAIPQPTPPDAPVDPNVTPDPQPKGDVGAQNTPNHNGP